MSRSLSPGPVGPVEWAGARTGALALQISKDAPWTEFERYAALTQT